MKSFKLDKSGTSKKDLVSAGVFLAIIGIVVSFLIPPVGLGMALVGALLALGAKFSSE